MSLLLKIVFASVIFFSIVFASWYVIHGDLSFSADIGRDFHLLRELDEKKIVLIGPRSSTGLFHGPLWTYVNYPAFVIGHGNPVVVGYGWVLFVILFGIMSFYIADKLFGRNTAYLYSMMATLYTAFHARGMFNPHGAMFLIPLFFFLFVKYFQEQKIKYLIAHIIILSFIIQFQMADGIPLLILSGLAVFYKSIKTRKFLHILVYFLLPMLLINFIAFDVRHEFLLSKQVVSFVSPKSNGAIYKYSDQIPNRINLALQGTEILRANKGNANLILFLITIFLVLTQIKDKRNKTVYLSFLYFYFGFFVLSFINKGQILYFYLFPIFPLVLLIFSSLYTSRFKKPFLVLFFIVLALNLNNAVNDMRVSREIIGKDMYSWKFLNEASAKIFEGKGKELGYFVYSPDVLGYEAKYAMLYNAKRSKKTSFYFQKKTITYLFVQPPPVNNPYMKEGYWIEKQLSISASPSSVFEFPNKYKIYKYLLTDKEINIPFDPAIDPGLIFR